MWKDHHKQTSRRPPKRFASVGIALSILLLTVAGSWFEARWRNPAGSCITATPLDSVDAPTTLWQLRHIQGVRDAVGVLEGSLSLDDAKAIPWAIVRFYATQTDRSALAFLPPDLTLELYQGRLPDPMSTDEAVLSYELAQILRKQVGETISTDQRSFDIVGIWGPSARLAGNWLQISAAAVQSLSPLPPQPTHYVVLPEREQDVTTVAARIWHALPQLEVLSPAWEQSRARQERTVLVLAVVGAWLLALLVTVPFLGDLSSSLGTSPWITSLTAGAAGLTAGWLLILLGNGYAQSTLGLTPLQLTPRLACAELIVCALAGLLASHRSLGMSWTMRGVTMALTLTLCATGMVIIGAIHESLNLSISEAERTATNWLTVTGASANGQLVRDALLLPGIRGYAIEAYGGPVNQEESRWTGSWPNSGVLYGSYSLSAESLGSNPYRVGYWHGRALTATVADEAIVGYDLAQVHGWQVGDRIYVRDTCLVIVGIRRHVPYDPSSDVNYRIEVNLDTLRQIVHQPQLQGELMLLIPPARTQAEKSAFLQSASARLNVGQVSTINERLAKVVFNYPATWTLSSADASDAVRHARAVYANLALLGYLALTATAALAVIGAFTQKLDEEEGRVGLLQAFGAAEGHVLGEYLQQAIVLGSVSAALGVLAGWKLSFWLGELGPAQSAIWLFTPRLAAGVFFALVLVSLLSAIAPTSRAVRTSVVRSLYTVPQTGSTAAVQVTRGGSES